MIKDICESCLLRKTPACLTCWRQFEPASKQEEALNIAQSKPIAWGDGYADGELDCGQKKDWSEEE